ncbi:MAG: GHKL domain-containing protein [Gemmiger sp.]|nr:GHKL domain-containing protein [Gemmiger sp.]
MLTTPLAPARFFYTALNAPLMVPLVYWVISRWRFPPRVMRRLVAGLEVGLIAFAALLYLQGGSTYLTCWLVGTIGPAVCTVILYFCNLYAGGQAFFTIVTIMLDTAMGDMLAGALASRASPWWLPLRLGIAVVNALLIYFVCRKPLQDMLDANAIKWWWISPLPISIMLCMDYYLVDSTRRPPPLLALLLSAAAVLTYVTLYQFQLAINAQARATQDAALLRQEMAALERQAELAQAAIDRIRQFRHDTRHYVALLQGCIDSQDTAAAQRLLEAAQAAVCDTPVPTPVQDYTGNTLFDTLLTQTAARAQREGIDFSVQFTPPSTLPMPESELAVVLMNALENALNATALEPPGAPRHVSIEGTPRNGQFLVVVANSFTGNAPLDPETHLPKATRSGHGGGTRSLYNFAQKYGCLADCIQKDGQFKLRLLL